MSAGLLAGRAAPGRVACGSLDFEGQPVPLVVASGAADGPVLLVTGLQHAMEFSGPAAVDRVLCGLDLSALRGQLVCLPVANPCQVRFDMAQHTAAHARRETNLNRQWPGDAASNVELCRLAAMLWESVVARCDALVDFHCCRNVDPRFAAAAEGHAPSLALGRTLGLDAVDLQTAESYAAGMLFVEAADRRDVPAVLIESRPGGFQTREAVEACAGAVLRAMVHLGMLAGLPAAGVPASRPEPTIFRRSQAATELRCGTGGYLAPRRWPGEHVRRGEAVAVVRSLETFAVAGELVSPLDGAVACVGPADSGGLVRAGDVAVVVKPVTS